MDVTQLFTSIQLGPWGLYSGANLSGWQSYSTYCNTAEYTSTEFAIRDLIRRHHRFVCLVLTCMLATVLLYFSGTMGAR